MRNGNLGKQNTGNGKIREKTQKEAKNHTKERKITQNEPIKKTT